MPIFISRFSPDRVVGANLTQVRPTPDQVPERVEARTDRPEPQAQQGRQADDARFEQLTARLREALPALTAFAEQIADQLRGARSTGPEESPAADRPAQAETEQPQVPATRSDDDAEEGRAIARTDRFERPERRTPLPGVGALRGDDDVDRPGRLQRAPANPVREQLLDRFARLRNLARDDDDTEQGRRIEAFERLRAIVPALDRAIDGRIRLAANNRAQEIETPVVAPSALRETPTVEAVPPVAVPSEPDAAAPAAQPTAEQISQANTTPEIRENLQADTREVARGLSRDATAQLQENTRATAQNAVAADESRREAVQQESQSQVRELQVEARQLERDLRQTEREIRDQRNRALRSQSAGAGSPAAAAAAIGTNVNILAG